MKKRYTTIGFPDADTHHRIKVFAAMSGQTLEKFIVQASLEKIERDTPKFREQFLPGDAQNGK
jgi:hypothetical protein